MSNDYQNLQPELREELMLLAEMHAHLTQLQKDFMPEDTKVGQIQAFLDNFEGDMVCSKLLHHEALGRVEEPKTWEIREINEIMNQSVTGWTAYPNAGFLFLDKNEKPMVALHWEKYLEHIVAKYNRIYRIQMPKVTPHVCRHTFCSNMAKSGMNPKTLQYIMGHSDISVTLNVYTHVQFDDAQAEMIRLAQA